MSAQTEYKSGDIEVTANKDSGCKVKLEVSVSPAAAQSSYKKALKTINKEVSVPGFRRGKAPEAMIEKRYSKYVKEEWERLLTRMAYEESIKLTELQPYDQESVRKPSVKKCSKEDGAEIHFEYETEPEIPEIDTSGISLSQVDPEPVTDEMIDQAMKDLSVMFGSYDEVTDRAVQEGDFVTLDIEAIGEEENRTLCSDERFEVKEGRMGEWLRKLILDKNIGDVFEAMSENEKDSGVSDEDFKPTQCKVTVKGISTGNFPEIGDELATRIGIESFDKLKENINEDLSKRAEGDAKSKLEEQLDEKLLAMYEFEVPESLLFGEKRNRLEGLVAGLKQANTSDDMIRSMKDKLEEEATAEALKTLRLYFLTRKIAMAEKIEVSQEELVQEYHKQMWSVPVQERIINEQMEPSEIRSRLFVTVMMRKVRDHLIETALKS